MGALIGIVIQLTMLAIGLLITLAIWMVRLTVMLVAALSAEMGVLKLSEAACRGDLSAPAL